MQRVLDNCALTRRSGAVIVIWPELPLAVQSGVFCARAGRRGAGAGPVYVFGTSGSDGPGRACRSPAAVEPVADLLTEGLMTPG